MQPVVIYARHSTDKQTTSSQDQIARCQKYCLAKGYRIADVFSDEAISGAIPMNHRRGIQNLIDNAVTETFVKIVCEDLSRLSRDQGDIAHFFQKMLFLDIEIETVTEGTINELHIGLKGTMNALYLKDLGDKTRRGMLAAALKGSIPSGNAYGYDVIKEMHNGELVRGQRKINPEQAEVVRRIFKYYLEGVSINNICEGLNIESIPSPNGGKWVPSTLIGSQVRKTGLLRQTLYKGVYTYNKMKFKKHPQTGKRVSILRPESEWVYVPMPEMDILGKEIFDKTQKMIEGRSQKKRAVQEENKIKSVPEKKLDKRDEMRQWRAKQFSTKAHTQYLTTRRLHCSHCDLPIACYTRMKDRCHNRDCAHHQCLKRVETLNEVLLNLQNFNTDDVRKFNDLPKTELEKKCDNLKSRLNLKRIEARNILDHISGQKKGPETVLYLQEKEIECNQFKIEITKIEEKLLELKPLTEFECQQITRKFLLLVHEYEKKSTNKKTVGQLQSFIHRINVSEHKFYDIEYDILEIVKSLR